MTQTDWEKTMKKARQYFFECGIMRVEPNMAKFQKIVQPLLSHAVSEAKAYKGKLKREWYMKGAAEERAKTIKAAKCIVLTCYEDEDSREHRIHDNALDLVYSRLDALKLQ